MISGETRDGRHHAARILGFAAVREELGTLASGAQPTIEDAVRVHAHSLHLTAIGFRKIEFALAGYRFPFRK